MKIQNKEHKPMKHVKFVLIVLILALSSTLVYSQKKAPPQNKEIVLNDTLSKLKEDLTKEQAIIKKPIKPNIKSNALNLKEVFLASPIIYSILLLMNICSSVILLYTFLTFKPKDLIPKDTFEEIRSRLVKEDFDGALSFCENKNDLLAKMITSGINARKHGAQFMMDTIKSEGRRATQSFWHRVGILNDIVVVAPMLGLLGTVIGMFYAFYDINRSIESLTALFDGLGIAVGTTVAGLIVAIIAMGFHAILKYRMIKTLQVVENNAVSLASLITTKEGYEPNTRK